VHRARGGAYAGRHARIRGRPRRPASLRGHDPRRIHTYCRGANEPALCARGKGDSPPSVTGVEIGDKDHITRFELDARAKGGRELGE
jgi:hypothetical protein